MFDEDEEWAEGYGDHGDDGEAEELPCPECGALVYEEAQQCPHCGAWIMPHAASARASGWLRWVGVLVVLALLAGLVRGVFRVL